jgi:TonB-dependent SusC/RagA subfamily outer membrane receptor
VLQYLIKFSISLAVLYIFYRAVLRPLTFYHWNRFYLLGYSLLSFVIPFIDISGWIPAAGDQGQRYISIIPSVSNYTLAAGTNQPSFFEQFTLFNRVMLVVFSGMLIMLIRLLLQYVSLYRLRRRSQLLTHTAPVALYETNESIAPFSFGNAIYINPSLHAEEELQRIIQHEFVHVRQKHSIDLLVAELLCVVNWFNPFAWAIRYAIRQNLEFIADHTVIANGIAKKEYQYLLLKVIGVNQYALASHFNFANLKKRIAMMNKMKSAQLHLTKFMFVLPLLALLLVAFRAHHADKDKTVVLAGLLVDAANMQPLHNASIKCSINDITALTDERGFYSLEIPYGDKPLHFTLMVTKPGYTPLHQTENWGDFNYESIRNKYRFSVELFGLSKTGEGFSRLAGNTRSREELNYNFAVAQLHLLKAEIEGNGKFAVDTLPAPPPPPPMANKKGYVLTIADNNGECIVIVKDKQRNIIKAITLEEWNKDSKGNEAKYGAIPPAPPPPPPPVKSGMPDAVAQINIHAEKGNRQGATINKATVVLKNGVIEEYNLDIPAEKKAYLNKYGPLPEKPMAPVLPTPLPPVGAMQPLAPTGAIEPVKVIPAVPFNTDASQPKEPPAVTGGGLITLRGVDAAHQPLYILDGKETPEPALRSINPNEIEKIEVLKDAPATSLYGKKGKNGVILLTTRKSVLNLQLPPGAALIILDGKELPAGSKIDDYVKPDAVESFDVLKGKHAADKYGEKGKNGVIEVKTKKPISLRQDKVENIVWTRDNKTTHFSIWQGVDKDGIARSKNLPAGIVYFVNGSKSNKKEVDAIDPQKIKAVNILKGPAAIEKYNDGGKTA